MLWNITNESSQFLNLTFNTSLVDAIRTTSTPFMNTSFTTVNVYGNTTNATGVLPYGFSIDYTAKMSMYIAYGAIAFIGILGNLFVIYFIGIKHKDLRSFDIQILSLATADLLAAIFTPLVSMHDLYTEFTSWYLAGTFGCKIFVSIGLLTVLVSSFSLVVISAERFRVIGSIKTIHHSPKRSVFINLIIWMLALAVVSPYMHAQEVRFGSCWAYKWEPIHTFIYYSVYIGLSCFVPVVLLIGIYSAAIYMLSQKEVPGEDTRLHERRKKQYKGLTIMFGSIVLLFFVLTTPYMVFQFIVSYYGTFDLTYYFGHHELFMSLHYAFYTISHFNCCGNPFIYAKMHKNLRRSLTKHLVTLLRGSGARIRTETVQSTTDISVATIPSDRETNTAAAGKTGKVETNFSRL